MLHVPEALATALHADWPWIDHCFDEALPVDHPHKAAPFPGDNLIAAAVNCYRQSYRKTAPLTAEDAAILNYDGFGFGNDQNKRRYICSLNL